MKVSVQVVKSNMEAFNALRIENASIRHVEFDKLVVQGSDMEFELWHRNIIIEENALRIQGFALYNDKMGRIECLVTPEL